MVKQDRAYFMSEAELQKERQEMVIKTLEALTGVNGLRPLRLLDREGVSALLNKSLTTIDSYRKRSKNPLVMEGSPPLIEDWKVWDWYKAHSGDYQE